MNYFLSNSTLYNHITYYKTNCLFTEDDQNIIIKDIISGKGNLKLNWFYENKI